MDVPCPQHVAPAGTLPWDCASGNIHPCAPSLPAGLTRCPCGWFRPNQSALRGQLTGPCGAEGPPPADDATKGRWPGPPRQDKRDAHKLSSKFEGVETTWLCVEIAVWTRVPSSTVKSGTHGDKHLMSWRVPHPRCSVPKKLHRPQEDGAELHSSGTWTVPGPVTWRERDPPHGSLDAHVGARWFGGRKAAWPRRRNRVPGVAVFSSRGLTWEA